jgi:hypothetical protein
MQKAGHCQVLCVRLILLDDGAARLSQVSAETAVVSELLLSYVLSVI